VILPTEAASLCTRDQPHSGPRCAGRERGRGQVIDPCRSQGPSRACRHLCHQHQPAVGWARQRGAHQFVFARDYAAGAARPRLGRTYARGTAWDGAIVWWSPDLVWPGSCRV